MNIAQSDIPRYNGLIKWFIFFDIGVLVLLSRWIFGIDRDVGYALLLVGILITLTCLAVLPLFLRRKKQYEHLTRGQGTVVGWHMDNTFFAEAAKRKRSNALQRNRSMLIMVGILFLIISVVFLLVLRDNGGFSVFFVCLGVLVLIALYALIAPRAAYARSLRKGHYAFVGEDSALIGSELHVFSGKMSRVEDAVYVPDDQALFVEYVVLTRTGPTPYTAEIPVPNEYAKQAAYIAQAIKDKHSV